ncbi:hypothetical protein B5M09_014044 [Aphanomyces astaci]|uniref:CCHC-type domain-containing protein n=1 Tax=Aphanomyces astaci TaxID=112090 RepID=A0A425CWQ8_APHAT|nr:hypothetical protein B5M09_014044 [Aphanomyces astaci]
MGSDGGYGPTVPQVWNAPALPQPSTFSAERRAFMRKYQKYLGQINALQCNGSHSVRDARECLHGSVFKAPDRAVRLQPRLQCYHDDEWVAWFKSAFKEGPQDLDVLKQRLQRAIRFDMKILDAESRAGRRLDELMRSLEQDHQEWVLHQQGKMFVEVMTKSIKPESLKTADQKQLDREDSAKNNGRVGGKAEAIVPKTAEPPARKGCLKCGDMSHRVARCPKTVSGEAETLLAAQVKLWKDGIKVLVNQPQRQKAERGVLLENIVRMDDVL